MSTDRKKFSSENKSRIMIVEDHPIFRLGLCELINQEDDLVVCGEAETIPSAWKKIQKEEPDMVIIDISLKDRIGIDLIKDICRHYSTIPVLVLSMHDEALYAERSLAAGAKGYVRKQEASDSIVEAIRRVLSGKTYFSPEFTEKMFSRFARQPRDMDKPSIERLTDRELEVFKLFGGGFTTKQIADTLNLSIKTIGTYRERIKEKLGLQSTNELIMSAATWGKEP